MYDYLFTVLPNREHRIDSRYSFAHIDKDRPSTKVGKKNPWTSGPIESLDSGLPKGEVHTLSCNPKHEPFRSRLEFYESRLKSYVSHHDM